MRIIRILICIFTIQSLVVAHADAMSTVVHSQGDTRIAITNDKFGVQVTIKTHEVEIGKPSDPRPKVIETSCTYSKYPCSVVDWVSIAVNGKALFVPRSVFADLADLSYGEIEATKTGWMLTLVGGDASETYVAKIEFDSNRVKRRTILSMTIPNQPLQETTYNDVVEGEN